MITLTSGVINPAFIEEAYISKATTRSSDGGWYLEIGCHNYHWSPTSTVVVIHYASGRTCVYGGNDANTIWVALHGTPAYVDETPCVVLSGHGITVKVKGSTEDLTYEWIDSSPKCLPDDTSATALFHLLADNGYTSVEWLDGREATYDEGLCVLRKGSRDRDLIMPYSS